MLVSQRHCGGLARHLTDVTAGSRPTALPCFFFLPFSFKALSMLASLREITITCFFASYLLVLVLEPYSGG